MQQHCSLPGWQSGVQEQQIQAEAPVQAAGLSSDGLANETAPATNAVAMMPKMIFFIFMILNCLTKMNCPSMMGETVKQIQEGGSNQKGNWKQGLLKAEFPAWFQAQPETIQLLTGQWL